MFQLQALLCGLARLITNAGRTKHDFKLHHRLAHNLPLMGGQEFHSLIRGSNAIESV